MYVRQYVSDARAREKPCLRCGQSLRQNLNDRHCPQCGLSVWMSLNANDSLDYSSARWLRLASRGAWFLAAIQLIAMAAYLTAFVGMATALVAAVQKNSMQATTRPAVVTRTDAAQRDEARQNETRPNEPRVTETQANEARPAPPLQVDAGAEPDPLDENGEFEMPGPAPLALAVATALTGIYFLCEAGGLVLLTAHEQRYPDRAKTARLMARVVAGCAAVLGVGLLICAERMLTAGYAPGAMAGWLMLLAVEVTFAGCAFCSWLWLRTIARRASRSGLARLCGYLLFLPVLPFLKAAPFLGLWMFYLVSPLLHFLPLIYIPVSIFLIARCAWLLQQAIPHAEAAWAAETQLKPTPNTAVVASVFAYSVIDPK